MYNIAGQNVRLIIVRLIIINVQASTHDAHDISLARTATILSGLAVNLGVAVPRGTSNLGTGNDLLEGEACSFGSTAATSSYL